MLASITRRTFARKVIPAPLVARSSTEEFRPTTESTLTVASAGSSPLTEGSWQRSTSPIPWSWPVPFSVPGSQCLLLSSASELPKEASTWALLVSVALAKWDSNLLRSNIFYFTQELILWEKRLSFLIHNAKILWNRQWGTPWLPFRPTGRRKRQQGNLVQITSLFPLNQSLLRVLIEASILSLTPSLGHIKLQIIFPWWRETELSCSWELSLSRCR